MAEAMGWPGGVACGTGVAGRDASACPTGAVSVGRAGASVARGGGRGDAEAAAGAVAGGGAEGAAATAPRVESATKLPSQRRWGSRTVGSGE
jgi:hypothetical protein